MKIQPVSYFNFPKNTFKHTKGNYQLSNFYDNTKYNLNLPYSYFPFMGRVDKGLNAFMDRNRGQVPYTVVEYVNNIDSAQAEYMTPLQAQKDAFSDLEYCENVEDVKELFPVEPLFADLKNSSQSKATHGILYDIAVMKEVLEETNETVISTGEDFTVYLLKKLFMEAKTIEETNSDLDNDINPVFKKEDKNYISSSTLKALGIKLPSVSYINSLKYTREGYSDAIGQQISDRWNALSEDEKIERISALLDSNKNLSPERRQQLKKTRSRLMKKRWENMSASQKVEHIQKMQTGSENNRVVSTYAWNNSKQIREEMSKYFIQNNFYNPHSIIYRDSSYSNALSILMTNFWKNNPKFAVEFGDALSRGHEEFQNANEEKRLEQFIEETYSERDAIKKQLKDFAVEFRKASATKSASFAEDFQNIFYELPPDLIEYVSEIVSKYPTEHQDIYLKACKGMTIKKKEAEIVKNIDSELGNSDFNRYSAFLYSAQKMFFDMTRSQYGIKSSYLLSNDRLTYHSIFALISKIKKDGYQNVSISENLMNNMQYKIAFDKIGALKHLKLGKRVHLSNGIVLDPNLLSNYKYTFYKKPDLAKLKEDYESYSTEYTEDEIRELTNIAYSALSGMQDFTKVNNVLHQFFELGNASKMVLDDKLLGYQYWIDGFNVVKTLTYDAKERKVCDEMIDYFGDKLVDIMLSQEANS